MASYLKPGVDDCGHCGLEKVYARNLCRACYRYQERNGRLRPHHLLVKSWHRKTPKWVPAE